MAKHAIFNQSGDFLHLAESDSEKDSLSNKVWPAYLTKEISDQLFEDVANSQKFLKLESDNSMTETENAVPSGDPIFENETVENQKTHFTDTIKSQISLIEDFININSTHSDLSIWQDYLSKLESINIDSISFPVSNNSFQQWFNSQPGYPSKNIFQLP
tara:strand:- start:132 stop:608 length:477 start_codon:yes stop_codon:yes gene_type:complete